MSRILTAEGFTGENAYVGTLCLGVVELDGKRYLVPDGLEAPITPGDPPAVAYAILREKSRQDEVIVTEVRNTETLERLGRKYRVDLKSTG